MEGGWWWLTPDLPALGKPVITSNSALMYVCFKRLNIEIRDIEAGGYLFTRRN
jgi:maleate cis-trans isomerase